MEKSYKFKHIENNLLKLLNILLQNQNLKKYIYYLSDDPLSHPNVSENLVNTGHIILNLFNKDVLEESKVMLFINPYKGNLRRQPLSILVYTIDIITPCKNWLLNGLGQLRPFRIADEISQSVDQKDIMGATEVNIVDFTTYKVNDSYSGMTLFIEVKSTAMKGLR